MMSTQQTSKLQLILSPKDVYELWADKALRNNPEWWGRYDQQNRVKNAWIFAKEGRKVVEKMSWSLFREVSALMYWTAGQMVIAGWDYSFDKLGRLCGAKIQRGPESFAIDWINTRKNIQAQGRELNTMTHKDKVFYTDETYCRIKWLKNRALESVEVYEFVPSDGIGVTKNMHKAFSKRFSQALTDFKLLEKRYRYYPYIEPKKKDDAL